MLEFFSVVFFINYQNNFILYLILEIDLNYLKFLKVDKVLII